jgi:hypothetical protein
MMPIPPSHAKVRGIESIHRTSGNPDPDLGSRLNVLSFAEQLSPAALRKSATAGSESEAPGGWTRRRADIQPRRSW